MRDRIWSRGDASVGVTVASFFDTSACPDAIRIYTADRGVLADAPFAMTDEEA